MAFEYAVTVPDRCICRWKERQVEDLPPRVYALYSQPPWSLHDTATVMARLSLSMGCPVHEPPRPFHTVQCGAPRCGRDIIWAKVTRTGRWMPVDAEPSPDGSVMLRWVAGVAEPQAEVLSVAQTRQRQLLAGSLRLSHFASCPDAERFRRPR